MKIEKGNYYYHKGDNKIRIADRDIYHSGDDVTDKIAVHTPTQEDWDYVLSKIDNKYNINSWDFGMRESESCINLKESKYRNKEFYEEDGYEIISINQFKEYHESKSQLQPHYDNTHGSLYKIAEQRGWNSYQFDIIKRIDRALKKGQFKEDLKKTKDLIDLWESEVDDEQST